MFNSGRGFVKQAHAASGNFKVLQCGRVSR
jgi:hypothetical protein